MSCRHSNVVTPVLWLNVSGIPRKIRKQLIKKRNHASAVNLEPLTGWSFCDGFTPMYTSNFIQVDNEYLDGSYTLRRNNCKFVLCCFVYAMVFCCSVYWNELWIKTHWSCGQLVPSTLHCTVQKLRLCWWQLGDYSLGKRLPWSVFSVDYSGG